jgi:small subunit ribosomal protein S6
MRQYEVAFIAHPELDEEGVTTLTEKVQGWITTSGGTVEKIDRWGKKRLAYEIRKQRDGHYVLIYATMNAGGPGELERNLRLNEQFLRFMITRIEEGAAPVAAAPAEPAEPAAVVEPAAPAPTTE